MNIKDFLENYEKISNNLLENVFFPLNKKKEILNEDELLKKKIADFYKEIEGQNVPESFIKNAINLIKQNHKNDKSGDYAIKAQNKSKKDSDKLKNIWKSYNK